MSQSLIFWTVAGYDDDALDLILEVAGDIPSEKLDRLAILLDDAELKLVFTKLEFVKSLLSKFRVPPGNGSLMLLHIRAGGRAPEYL